VRAASEDLEKPEILRRDLRDRGKLFAAELCFEKMGG